MKKDTQSMWGQTFKSSVKVITRILSLLMTSHAAPTNVYAALAGAFSTNTTDTVIHETSGKTEEQISKTIFKVVNRREETAKHFRTEDGTYVAAQYDYPVRKLDSNNKWQDVDNTMAEVNGKYATPNARVKFAKKTTGNETLFTLHNGNRKITTSMFGANKKVAGQGTNTHTEFGEEATKLPKMMTLYGLFSQILYPDILNDVDLEYIIQPNSIKKNVIVKERSDKNESTRILTINAYCGTIINLVDFNAFCLGGAL